jgi:CheY-like chemotaxis protein
LRAFDVHAVDYLLKPFDAARFQDALGRAIDRATSRRPENDERLRALLADYLSSPRSPQPEYLDRVAVKHDGTLRIVRTADVDWWEADGNYVRLHTAGSSFLVRSTMAAIEGQLDPRLFISRAPAVRGQRRPNCRGATLVRRGRRCGAANWREGPRIADLSRAVARSTPRKRH